MCMHSLVAGLGALRLALAAVNLKHLHACLVEGLCVHLGLAGGGEECDDLCSV